MEKLFAAHPDVRLVVADAQQDNSKQIAQIETFIRQKPDLLIVAPNERAALTAVMGQAMEAHIRPFAWNAMCFNPITPATCEATTMQLVVWRAALLSII